jgi:hypothetical protein
MRGFGLQRSKAIKVSRPRSLPPLPSLFPSLPSNSGNLSILLLPPLTLPSLSQFKYFEAKPPHASLLSSYNLEELKGFCAEEKIDYSQYLNTSDEKEKIIEALSATYPPDPIRQYHLLLLELESDLRRLEENSCRLDQKQIGTSQEMQVLIRSIDTMFELLLTKLDLTEERRSILLNSFSFKEKISYLRNSIW